MWNAEMANEVIEAYHLDEILVIKSPASCCDVKSSADQEPAQYVSSIKKKFLRDFVGIVALFMFLSLNVTYEFSLFFLDVLGRQ